MSVVRVRRYSRKARGRTVRVSSYVRVSSSIHMPRPPHITRGRGIMGRPTPKRRKKPITTIKPLTDAQLGKKPKLVKTEEKKAAARRRAKNRRLRRKGEAAIVASMLEKNHASWAASRKT